MPKRIDIEGNQYGKLTVLGHQAIYTMNHIELIMFANAIVVILLQLRLAICVVEIQRVVVVV